MTPETKLKKEVAEYLRSLGTDCWFYQPVMNGYGKRGIPDFVGCYKRYFFAIETKSPEKEPTPWQIRTGNEIGCAQGAYMLAYKIEDIKAVFHAIQ